MSDLVRFGVAMDRTLLAEFDRRIAARGYENRSEALRDLIRADLTREAGEAGALVAGTVTLVYSNRARELVARLADAEGEQPGLVVSSLRTPIDADRTLEALVVRGAADVIAAFSGRLAGTKGVLSCDVILAAVLDPRAERRPARPAAAPSSPSPSPSPSPSGRDEPR
jgi:CopG family transcriptional regulator, nickel-responsive regulator